ncbi:hypothetical protein ERO13_A12G104700v2 [Gossypium hirsutum]|nr:hypothetical protein ERO13_A12G104700v2 [Gossypium hirsutum]
MTAPFPQFLFCARFLFLNPSSQVVLHSSTVDGGFGSIERAFQPLIKPRLKAKPSRPGRSRSGGFSLSLWSSNPMMEGGVPATRFGCFAGLWKVNGQRFPFRCKVTREAEPRALCALTEARGVRRSRES